MFKNIFSNKDHQLEERLLFLEKELSEIKEVNEALVKANETLFNDLGLIYTALNKVASNQDSSAVNIFDYWFKNRDKSDFLN